MPAPEESPHLPAAWIELPDRTTVLLTGDCRIGRIKGNEIVNPDTRVSRHNSVVQRQGNHFVLVDLGSTNGTFLNDSRIFKPTRLKHGDVILVGAERYTFREPDLPGPATDPNDSLRYRTEVVVGKTNCWMLLAVPPGAGALVWAEQLRATLLAAGAGVKRLPDGGLLAHWREGKTSPEKVRGFLIEFARQSRPPGTRLIGHYGVARVGPSANPAEENLLGVEVSFTHQLGRAAIRPDADILLSEAAVRSLSLESSARPLGAQAVAGLPGTHPLFAI
jgi:FHA domain